MTGEVWSAERLAELRELAAGDDGFLRSVLDVFLGQLATTPAEIREAAAGGDAARLAELAHSLKGSAANVGADCLAEACRRVEVGARDGEPAEVLSALLEDLAEAVRRTRDASPVSPD